MRQSWMGEEQEDTRLPPELRPLDRMVVRLGKQRAFAAQAYTFLAYAIEHDFVWEKYRDSLSGNAINLQIICVENALAMYCNRVWDRSAQSQSIPNIIRLVKDFKERGLYCERISLIPEESIVHAQNLSLQPIRQALRVIRTESLAHLLEGSRDRNDLLEAGVDSSAVTINQMLDFAKETVILTEKFYNSWMGASLSFSESASIFSGHCEAYWSNLPVFREVE